MSNYDIDKRIKVLQLHFRGVAYKWLEDLLAKLDYSTVEIERKILKWIGNKYKDKNHSKERFDSHCN